MLIKRRRVNRKRKQEGQYCVISGRWYLRFWVRENDNGTLIRKRKTFLLGPKTTKGSKPPDSIRELAEDHMRSLHRSTISLDRSISIATFVDEILLPWARAQKRPSTSLAYEQVWRCHLENQIVEIDSARKRAADLPVWSAEPQHMQGWIDAVVDTSTRKLSSSTVKHCKFFLSALFRLALQKGYRPIERGHPVEHCSIPTGTAPKKPTVAYSAEDVQIMLAVLPEPARTIVATAALTGLRIGEVSALDWQDLQGYVLVVSKSNWRGHISPPKTDASAAPVTIHPYLRTLLEAHRLRSGKDIRSGPIFRTGDGTYLSMGNVLNRQILPVLRACAICGKMPGKRHHLKQKQPHEYVRNQSMATWAGWHAFRRSVATSLQTLGANITTAQGALRHSDASVTLRHYVKIIPNDVRSAMTTFGNALVKPFQDSNGTLKQGSVSQTESVN